MDDEFLTLVFKKNPDIVYRVIAGEAILVPTTGEMQKAGRLFTLNETGAFIWDLIDGRRKTGGILRRLVEEYGVEEETARRDMRDLILKLEKIKALNRVKAKPRSTVFKKKLTSNRTSGIKVPLA